MNREPREGEPRQQAPPGRARATTALSAAFLVAAVAAVLLLPLWSA